MSQKDPRAPGSATPRHRPGAGGARLAAGLLGLALLFLPGIGNHALWNPDEPRFGEAIRVMWLRGDWWTPRLNGEIYPNKPILYFIAGLASSALLGGPTETTIRLPSALAAIATVVVTHRLGVALFGPTAALFGALVLATSQRVLWQARWAQTDMLLTLWITIALASFHRIVTDGRAKPGTFVCLYVSLGLAVLTKGLAGLVLPGLVAACWIAARRDWGGIRRIRPVEGALVFLAVTAPWFVHMTRIAGTEYLEEFFLHQHLVRFVDAFDHAHSALFYLWSFPADFLPWTPFLPAAVVCLKRSRGEERRNLGFLATWFAAIFAFFTLSSAKRGLYLLPLFPPAALLVGKAWDAARGDSGLRRWIATPWRVMGLAVSSAAAVASGAVLTGMAERLAALLFPEAAGMLPSLDGWERLGIAACLLSFPLAFAVLSLTCRSMKDGRAAGAFLVTIMCVISLLVATLAFPFMDRFKSIVPFAATIRKDVGPHDPLKVYGYSLRYHINYYSGREVIERIESDEELERYLASPERVFLIAERKRLARFLSARPFALETLAEAPPGERPIVLVATR